MKTGHFSIHKLVLIATVSNIYAIYLFISLLHCTGAGVVSVAMSSSLAALEVVISTTYGAASDESARGWRPFRFSEPPYIIVTMARCVRGGSQWDQFNLTVTSLCVSCRSHCNLFACYYYFMLRLFILRYLCRTIALVATVICWLYPTLNKFYLILSYLNLAVVKLLSSDRKLAFTLIEKVLDVLDVFQSCYMFLNIKRVLPSSQFRALVFHCVKSISDLHVRSPMEHELTYQNSGNFAPQQWLQWNVEIYGQQ